MQENVHLAMSPDDAPIGAVSPPAPVAAAGSLTVTTSDVASLPAVRDVDDADADDVAPDGMELDVAVQAYMDLPRDGDGRLSRSAGLTKYLSKMPALLVRAKMEEMARLVVYSGGQITVRELKKRLKTRNTFIAACLAGEIPEYLEIQNAVNLAVWGTADDAISNEKVDEATRKDALKKRAMTVLGDVMSLVHDHAERVRAGDTPAKAALLKSAVDAAAQVRQWTEVDAGVGHATPQRVSITNVKATIIGGALKESGVDLSDILRGGSIIDAEVVPNAVD